MVGQNHAVSQLLDFVSGAEVVRGFALVQKRPECLFANTSKFDKGKDRS